MKYDIVIVGGGQAGSSAAIMLRQAGYAGTIAIIGREPDLPYERPPLSKDYLLGEKAFEKLLIRPADFWQAHQVDMHLGCEVVSVDPTAQEVGLRDQRRIGYGILIWAAGGDARRLACPGADLRGIHSIRDRADVDAIQAALSDVREIVVIGGGYIGLEAAAAFRALGKSVTLVELLPRVLARVAGEDLSAFVENHHRTRGVDIRTGVVLEGFVGDGRLEGVRLADGGTIPAQMAIVGVGIAPQVAPLIAAGASGTNGVDVDEHCRTSLPNIYAVGDCAAHQNVFASGRAIRLESVQNANDQAACAVATIMGQPAPYRSTPWFWSNQYELRLQTVGISSGHDQAVVRGDPSTGSFSIVYLHEGRVVALDCVNQSKDYIQGRKLVEAGCRPAVEALLNPAVALKQLMT